MMYAKIDDFDDLVYGVMLAQCKAGCKNLVFTKHTSECSPEQKQLDKIE